MGMGLKFKSSEKDIYWSSDLHINHAGICKSTSHWPNKDRTRDFESINKMNEAIFHGINSTVTEDSHLFLLGDLTFRFKRPEDYWRVIDRINCNNIYLIFGNHDHRDSLSFCDHPKIQFLGDYLEIRVDGRLICMSHYAFRVWNQSHKGSWQLFGHSHDSIEGKGKQMDVGLESYHRLFGEYKPFNYHQVKDILDKESIWAEDYHNKTTT